MIDERRIHVVADNDVNGQGDYVLYWMTASRRTRYNASLERAVSWSVRLNKPLVVLEALSIDYPWASARHHQFIVDGMIDQSRSFLRSTAAYYPYVEREPKAGRGLVLELSRRAAVLITDHFPCFFLPNIVGHIARQSPCRMESIDSNGVLPISAAGKAFTSAYTFRRFMQKNVLDALAAASHEEPLSGLKPGDSSTPHIKRLQQSGVGPSVLERWCPTALPADSVCAVNLTGPHLDATVAALPFKGGETAGLKRAYSFVDTQLSTYTERRNKPQESGTSGLSPYLHFGHISSLELVRTLLARFAFDPDSDTRNYKGQRAGFWELPEAVEAFLDQIITWRELGYGFCHHTPGYDQYETLPNWALKTLDEHRNDERPYRYDHHAFEEAQTHDPLWNAAQNQLRRDGRIHNYLRMLWGKKILHWTADPEQALNVMVELNNKYALDGRNPNSYSGIFWTLGRFDRAWGPERPIFGKVRYMTSQSTARKFSVKQYIADYEGMSQTTLF